MSRKCAVRSCSERTGGFSTLCETHKRTQRRHGHPQQQGVTVFELKPFIERIHARRAKNPGNPTWELLRGRWEALTAHAEATMARYNSGVAGIRHERQTAEQLVMLKDSVEADVVIDTALAMFAFQEFRPARFKSDRAFHAQLSRRVRGLARANAGRYLDRRTGRMKLAYRDWSPAALETLAQSLGVAFGVPGMRLAALEMKEQTQVVEEKQRMVEALKEMQ